MLIKKLNVVLEIDLKELPAYKLKGFEEYGSTNEGAQEEEPTLEGKTYGQWTAANLLAYANEANIDLTGKTGKSDIWNLIIPKNGSQEGGE